MKSEISTLSATGESEKVDTKVCSQTKDGGRFYLISIRELYYNTILKSFLPSSDVNSSKLPSESCALYMRRQELTTVNLAHIAISLLDQTQSSNFSYSDGITLARKKLQGAAISGTVISVNEIPDGGA